MVARFLFISFALTLPLGAADVPISDRPFAPLPGIAYIAAAASPESVLVVFRSENEYYLQRLRGDGTQLDATVRPLGSSPGGTAPQVAWDGRRWAVLWGGPLRLSFVEASGVVSETRPLDFQQARLAALGGDIVLAVSELVGMNETISLVAAEPEGFRVLSTSTLTGVHGWWPISLEDGPAIMEVRSVHQRGVVTHTFSFHPPKPGVGDIHLNLTVPAPFAFFAGANHGGLFVWSRDGLRGAILRADGTLSDSFAIGPPAVRVDPSLAGTQRSGGWDLLFTADGATHLATVSHDGTARAAAIETDDSFRIFSETLLARGTDPLLIDRRPIAGISVRRITSAVEDPFVAGLGAAAQRSWRTARGRNVDIVVWEEQAHDGIVLKATRVGSDGRPFDGAGIPIATDAYGSSYGFDYDVVFDGETFLIGWVNACCGGGGGGAGTPAREPERRSVVIRRVSVDGVASHRLVLAEWDYIGALDMETSGDGRSAVAWAGYESGERKEKIVLVPIDRGVIRPAVLIAEEVSAYAPLRLGASRNAYLALFNDIAPCYVICPPPTATTQGRLLNFDGGPLTDVRQLSTRRASFAQVASNGSDFFVTWDDVMVRVDRNLSSGPEWKIARIGSLSVEHAEIWIDAESTRSVYSVAGDLLRLEPAAGLFSGSRRIVSLPASPRRLYIRTGDTEPRTADLAVVPLGKSDPTSAGRPTAWRFRIEHRGGAPVTRLDLWSGTTGTAAFAMIDGALHTLPLLLDRKMKPGDSIDVEVQLYDLKASPFLWVAGDAVDLVPLNNGDSFARPIRHRMPTARP